MANAKVTLRLPKRNANYRNLGALFSDTLVPNAYAGTVPTITAAYGDIGLDPTASVTVTGSPTVQLDVVTNYDDYTVQLENPELSLGKVVYLYVDSISNPMSLKPLTGFKFYTADTNGNQIEKWEQEVAEIKTLTPGTLSSGTGMIIVDDKTKISETDVEFQFTLVTPNDIPLQAKV